MTVQDTKKRMRPSAEHRGAPNVAAWKNPTLWLFVGSIAALGVSVSYLWGAIPAGVAIALGVLGRYLGFTVMHDSMHRAAHPSKVVNETLGWATALPLTITLPMFRSCHTKHHTNTNNPQIDPDFDVARDPGLLRPIWLLSPLWTYRSRYFRQGWAKTDAHRRIQLALDVALLGAATAAVVTGHTMDLLVVFVVPLLLALGFLTFAFDLLPHLPYDSTERFYDTRALPSRALNVVLLGQNYHLVHHLWNSVPWYKYQRVFDETRDDLEEVGARVTWGA